MKDIFDTAVALTRAHAAVLQAPAPLTTAFLVKGQYTTFGVYATREKAEAFRAVIAAQGVIASVERVEVQ